MRARPLGGGHPTWDLHVHEAAEAELVALPADLQRRFSRAFENLEIDPLTPRSGADVKKLQDVKAGSLYRLRVGGARACYILVSAHRRIWVMVVDFRGLGYDRMIATAISRSSTLMD